MNNILTKIKDFFKSEVKPMDNATLETKTIKKGLGMYLIQNFTIAFIWSVGDGVLYPWLMAISAFLQVGWIWSKVTESWKLSQNCYYRYPLDPDISNKLDQEMQPLVCQESIDSAETKYHSLV